MLLAGGTGYLGGYVVRELQRRAIPFRAIARQPKRLQEVAPDQIIRAEVTRPDTLAGCCDGLDAGGDTQDDEGLHAEPDLRTVRVLPHRHGHGHGRTRVREEDVEGVLR